MIKQVKNLKKFLFQEYLMKKVGLFNITNKRNSFFIKAKQYNLRMLKAWNK